MIAACAQASAPSERGLALFRDGRENDARAIVRPAAEGGDTDSQYVYGLMYAEGGSPDHWIAARWYRRAAEKGHAQAQFKLGDLLDRGKGVPEDPDQAALWYRKAADAGHAGAQTNLGLMYLHGRGLPWDDQQARVWLALAADGGSAMAQYSLGLVHGKALGVPRNNVEAYKWFFIASRGGLEDARELLLRLDKEMDATEIAEAKRRAAAWEQARRTPGRDPKPPAARARHRIGPLEVDLPAAVSVSTESPVHDFVLHRFRDEEGEFFVVYVGNHPRFPMRLTQSLAGKAPKIAGRPAREARAGGMKSGRSRELLVELSESEWPTRLHLYYFKLKPARARLADAIIGSAAFPAKAGR